MGSTIILAPLNKKFMNRALHLTLVLCLCIVISTNAQQPTEEHNPKMEWFKDAKLGVFIHWGIYSVEGLSESWAFFNNYISHTDYMKQLDGFTASQYNPEDWAELIKKSGAQYSVLTTRHHDGVSLWDSKAEQAITTAKDAAAEQDVLSPFIAALQKTDVKTGLYYSLPDWSHPYYDVNTKTKKRYDIEDDPQRWADYVTYYQTQLKELSQKYKPDLLWFDGDWEHSSEEWNTDQTLDLLKSYNPNIIINSRLDGKGDYETPEQGIPVVTPQANNWELCYTMNDSWGYQPFDKKYKSPNMIVRTLADVISMGGNLLVDIGPKEDGSIPSEQIDILENLGRWTSKHAEAIYNTRKGLPFKHYRGKSALSKDQKKLYLYLEENKPFTKIYGLQSEIKSAKVIGDSKAQINYEQTEHGAVHINLKHISFDQDVTVVELSFDEQVKLLDNGKETQGSLNKLMIEQNTQNAVYEIADQLHRGHNIFTDSKLTSDGEDMDLDLPRDANTETLDWIKKHAEALYKTDKGLPDGHYSGMSAVSEDKQTLYLFVEGKPTGPIALKGVKNDISRVRIVGEGSMLGHEVFNKLYWSDVPGIVYIDIPEERLDKNLTVISVLLDKPLELYREKIGAVEHNE